MRKLADPAKFPRDAEISANGLGVSHVQVPIRLWRKAGHDALHAAAGHIRVNDLTDKIRRR